MMDLAIDAAGIVGAALITYGVAEVYHPAGWITGGLFLLVGAWRMARKAG